MCLIKAHVTESSDAAPFFGDWGSVSNHHPSSSSNNNNNNTRNNTNNEHLLFARLSSETLTCIASFNPYAKCMCIYYDDPLYLRANSSSERLYGLLCISSLELRFCCMHSKENFSPSDFNAGRRAGLEGRRSSRKAEVGLKGPLGRKSIFTVKVSGGLSSEAGGEP